MIPTAPLAPLITTILVFGAPPPSPDAPVMAADTAAIRQAAEHVTRGQALVSDQRFAEAARAYDEAAARVPAFAPWAHLMAARALGETGDTAAVRRRHEAVGDPELVTEWGWSSVADAHLAAGDTVGALARLEASRRAVTNAGRRAQATHRLADLARTLGRPDATAAYREVVDLAPGSGSGLASALMLADSIGLDPADRLPVARIFLRHGEFARALSLIEQEIRAHPALEGELKLEAGLALWAARRYGEAERVLAPASAPAGTAVAADEIRAERVLFQGRSQFRDGRRDAGLATFRRVVAEHPETQAAARAHFLLADLAHDDGDLAVARRHYEAALRAGGEDASLAAMRLMTMSWAAGDRARALEILRAAGAPDVTTADGQQRAYWLARAGSPDRAELLESLWETAPFTFYGIRAAETLGRAGALGQRIRPWAGTTTPVDQRRAAEVADRAAVLAAANLVVRATYEVGRALESEEAPVLYALGAALHARVLPGQGVRVGRALQRQEGSWNDELLRMVYPFPYRAAIERESRRNGLDPYLVAGLIRQESGFNPVARSPAGAVGLMQIMPGTGTSLARELGVNPFRTARLTEPELNVRMGTRYLATMLGRYGGRTTDALAAYNAGPTRMSRWRAFPEHGDAELFTERIPFAETRDYVRIVQTNAAMYRAIYDGR